MNKLEKKSFLSFVLLYLVSATLFLLLSAYWYFYAQKLSIENIHYYKMQHVVDEMNTQIVMAHMRQEDLMLSHILDGKEAYELALFDTEKRQIAGEVSLHEIDFDRSYYQEGDKSVLISTGSHDHLNVHYVVLVSQALQAAIESLRAKVLTMLLIAFLMISLIGWGLSKMFLRPLRKKIHEIERFIKDITHELNTPITALMLSSNRLQNKAAFDAKIARNISISTKQLYEMYKALTFTSFSHNISGDDTLLRLDEVVRNSIDYFDELIRSKQIDIQSDLDTKMIVIDSQKASMLINNILSNAIKYSMPQTHIRVSLTKDHLLVEDEGIGIAKDRLEDIFKRFTRASDYAGGFGIGLSVIKHICDEYGFGIEISSEIDKGTSIKIIF